MFAKSRADFAALLCASLCIASLGARARAGVMKAPPVPVEIPAAAQAPLIPSADSIPSSLSPAEGPFPSLIQSAVMMAKPQTPVVAALEQGPQTQAFDNAGGGGEGPGDPPGDGGVSAARSRVRRIKPSSVRTRDQFIAFLLQRRVSELVVRGLARGVVDELAIRGDAAGEAFGEEETVRAAVGVILSERERFLIGAPTHQSVPRFLAQLSPYTVRLAAGKKIMLNRAHQDFRRLPGYDRESVNNWFFGLDFAVKELSWEEASRQLRELFEARDQTIRSIRDGGESLAEAKLFIKERVFPFVENGFAEILVLRALNRILKRRYLEDIYDLLPYHVRRESVIEKLSGDGRYSRPNLERWFDRREEAHLKRWREGELSERALISDIKRSLGRRKR